MPDLVFRPTILGILAKLIDVTMGFRVTAQLPAWYPHGGRRYDCVMVVRRAFEAEPVAHGFADQIGAFDARYARVD